MLDEDTATEEEITDVYDNMFTDVHTNESVNTPVHITTDAVYHIQHMICMVVHRRGEVTLSRSGGDA